MAKRISGSVLLLATLAFALVVGDVLARGAQDPQNQTATPQTQTTTPKKTTAPKRKRGQMKMNTPANETTTGDQTTVTPTDQTTPAQTPTETTTPTATAMPAQNMTSTQTDLSGTYAGTFNCDALGLTGDTTLTVNGNEFSTADGKTGRIVASTTHGYTAVALQTGVVPAATATTAVAGTPAAAPTIVSLRARKSGNRLTLMPVSGGTSCSFAPGRVARRARQTPAAAGATVASPAEVGPTPAEVTAPAKTGRRGSTRRTTTATPTPMTPTTMPNPTETPAQPTQPAPETPIPTQTPSPEPSPSPMPRPTPTVSPEPQPSPTGSPSPMPSPTPSPTPSPSPRPHG